ncbi:MAG: AAA family ATPase [Sulfolobaceae archaeon]|nr:AAA family ATPase [Sulfolobaceae archaeon]
MICNIPKVTVTTWSSKSVILVGPTYRKYLENALNSVRNSDVASIVGQPGMGKTTLLKKIEESVNGDYLPIYLDLANKERIDDEFWVKLDYNWIKAKALENLSGRKKEFGYTFFKKLMGTKFEDWLQRVCGKYDDPYLRLYCSSYSKDYDGMIRAIQDLRNLAKVVLLIDEVRNFHMPVIHRLINAGMGIPIIMAIPTDAYSSITDLAIRRRIEESRIPLDDALTLDDIKEIVEAYCKDVSEDLLPIVSSLWKNKELTTVSSILQFIKNQVENSIKECGGEDINCVKEHLKASSSIKDPELYAKEIEKKVRELLGTIGKTYGVTYVHPRGKRIEVKGKGIVAGIFFIAQDYAFLGDVLLSVDGKLQFEEDIKLLAVAEEVEHNERNYKIGGKFLITNLEDVKIDGITVISIPTLEIIKIVNGDVFLLEERVKILFDEFSKMLQSTQTVQQQVQVDQVGS